MTLYKIESLDTSKTSDVLAVLEIQMENHKEVLISGTDTKNGYLTFLSPPSYFFDGNITCFVAKQEENIAGYVMLVVNDEDMALYNRTISEIRAKIQSDAPQEIKNYYVILAQVAVAKTYHGKGIAKALYEHVLEKISGSYSAIVTMIGICNNHSTAFHAKMGFETLHTYMDCRIVAKKFKSK